MGKDLFSFSLLHQRDWSSLTSGWMSGPGSQVSRFGLEFDSSGFKALGFTRTLCPRLSGSLFPSCSKLVVGSLIAVSI